MDSDLPSTQPVQRSPEGDTETSQCIQVVKSPPTSFHYAPTTKHVARRQRTARSILPDPQPRTFPTQSTKTSGRHGTYKQTALFIIFLSSILHAMRHREAHLFEPPRGFSHCYSSLSNFQLGHLFREGFSIHVTTGQSRAPNS